MDDIKNQYKIIIPARAGSKRLKNKNRMMLGGKSLFMHSVDYALENFSSDNIWVNSDDEEILELGKAANVNVYRRPDLLAGDYTSTVEVLQDQLSFFEEAEINCEHIILLQPTNPLRPKGLLEEALINYESSSKSSLGTFSLLSKKFGEIEDHCFLPKNYTPGQRSQDLKKLYFENGLLYICQSAVVEAGIIISEDCFPMIVDHPFAEIDIDTEVDFLKAKLFLDYYKNQRYE